MSDLYIHSLVYFLLVGFFCQIMVHNSFIVHLRTEVKFVMWRGQHFRMQERLNKLEVLSNQQQAF